jgi:hypothetical protein
MMIVASGNIAAPTRKRADQASTQWRNWRELLVPTGARQIYGILTTAIFTCRANLRHLITANFGIGCQTSRSGPKSPFTS